MDQSRHSHPDGVGDVTRVEGLRVGRNEEFEGAIGATGREVAMAAEELEEERGEEYEKPKLRAGLFKRDPSS